MIARSLQSMGKTIVISSHILHEIAEMCSDLAIIQAGRLVVSGNVDHITHRLNTSRPLDIRIADADRVSEAIDLLKTIPNISNAIANNEHLIQADFSGKDDELHQVLATLISHSIPVNAFALRSGGSRLEEVFMDI